jgi:hypothetical protein
MSGSSEGARKRWATPGYKEKMHVIMENVWYDPGIQARKSDARRGVQMTESAKTKLRQTLSDPIQRARMSMNVSGDKNPAKRPDVRAKISASAKSRLLPKERIAQLQKQCREMHTSAWCKNQSTKMCGDKNPKWMGGISFEPYCPKFTKPLKDYIRQKFHHQCVRCGSYGNGRKLDVHHVDFNKMQGCKGQTWALIPLCRVCHAWTTNHRHDAFNTFINYWALNNEINFDVNEEFR